MDGMASPLTGTAAATGDFTFSGWTNISPYSSAPPRPPVGVDPADHQGRPHYRLSDDEASDPHSEPDGFGSHVCFVRGNAIYTIGGMSTAYINAIIEQNAEQYVPSTRSAIFRYFPLPTPAPLLPHQRCSTTELARQPSADSTGTTDERRTGNRRRGREDDEDAVNDNEDHSGSSTGSDESWSDVDDDEEVVEEEEEEPMTSPENNLGLAGLDSEPGEDEDEYHQFRSQRRRSRQQKPLRWCDVEEDRYRPEAFDGHVGFYFSAKECEGALRTMVDPPLVKSTAPAPPLPIGVDSSENTTSPFVIPNHIRRGVFYGCNGRKQLPFQRPTSFRCWTYSFGRRCWDFWGHPGMYDEEDEDDDELDDDDPEYPLHVAAARVPPCVLLAPQDQQEEKQRTSTLSAAPCVGATDGGGGCSSLPDCSSLSRSDVEEFRALYPGVLFFMFGGIVVEPTTGRALTLNTFKLYRIASQRRVNSSSPITMARTVPVPQSMEVERQFGDKPEPRMKGSAVFVGLRFYLYGGYNVNTEEEQQEGDDNHGGMTSFLDTVHEWNSLTGLWTRVRYSLADPRVSLPVIPSRGDGGPPAEEQQKKNDNALSTTTLADTPTVDDETGEVGAHMGMPLLFPMHRSRSYLMAVPALQGFLIGGGMYRDNYRCNDLLFFDCVASQIHVLDPGYANNDKLLFPARRGPTPLQQDCQAVPVLVSPNPQSDDEAAVGREGEEEDGKRRRTKEELVEAQEVVEVQDGGLDGGGDDGGIEIVNPGHISSTFIVDLSTCEACVSSTGTSTTANTKHHQEEGRASHTGMNDDDGMPTVGTGLSFALVGGGLGDQRIAPTNSRVYLGRLSPPSLRRVLAQRFTEHYSDTEH